MIVAVDFDGTLCRSPWPAVDDMDLVGIYVLKEFKKKGGRVILWTCRNGEHLQAAVDACAKYGLYFDAVNDNDPQHLQNWEAHHGKPLKYSPKIYADLYIDDKAMMGYEIPWNRINQYLNGVGDGNNFWQWFSENRSKMGDDKDILRTMSEYVGRSITSISQFEYCGTPYAPFIQYCKEKFSI